MQSLAPFAITDKSSRRAFLLAFKQLAHERALTPEVMAFYAIVTGKPLSAVFSPVTNANKLNNGQIQWEGAVRALSSLRWSSEVQRLAEVTQSQNSLPALVQAARSVSSRELNAEKAGRLNVGDGVSAPTAIETV